ncbi:MAG: hypothetical protein JWQ26_17, partial [Modestobacter sp.]|nr:hypothetical protein [Modestobacter sp.]
MTGHLRTALHDDRVQNRAPSPATSVLSAEVAEALAAGR